MKSTILIPFFSLALAPLPAAPSPLESPVIFLVTSDAHYDAWENEDRNDRVRDTLGHMNGIEGVEWPRGLGGGAIGRPRAVLVLGDILDDGDRLLEGRNQGARQWELYRRDFGLDGTDGLLRWPAIEGAGNHDGPPIGRERQGFSFQGEVRKRNLRRMEIGLLGHLDAEGLHASWDWKDVHFVLLNLYPADRPHPAVKYNPQYHDPRGALSFLRKDLEVRVGTSGRPVVLMSHYGFDCDWWHADDWRALYDTVEPFNVILYFHGHTGTKLYEWKPEGERRPLRVVNTGQTENGFFVVEIVGGRVRLAYRAKRWGETIPGSKARAWSGAWEWRFPLAFDLGPRPRRKRV